MANRNHQDPVEYGRESAFENDRESGHAEQRDRNEARYQETMEDARESARLNREAEEASQSDDEEGELYNDTSKSAKQATAKSQLDPTGDDPISTKEINDSATNASMDTGNKTAVTNEEAARRAANPGEAEENAPLSTANADNNAGEPADEDAAHPEKKTRKKGRRS